MKKFLLLISILFVFNTFASANGNLHHISNEKQFNALTKNKLVFADFYADWCGPCKAFAPTFKAVSGKLGNYSFLKVNTDENGVFLVKYNIKYIPHIVALFNGKEVSKFEGDRSEANFKAWCEEKISKYSNGNNNSDNDNNNNNNTNNTNNAVIYEFTDGTSKGFIALSSNSDKEWIYVSGSGVSLILSEYKVDKNYYYLEDKKDSTKYACPTADTGSYYIMKDKWEILFPVNKVK